MRCRETIDVPQIDRKDYTTEECRWCGAALGRLYGLIRLKVPDTEKFRRTLGAALAAGFPIDWPDKYGYTLLHEATIYSGAVRAGFLQILLEAGADVNVQNKYGGTPLGRACWYYVGNGASEFLSAIDVLLVAGARPELGESWNEGWTEPDKRARRDWLVAYIDTWHERRAAAKRENAPAPSFDYAL